MLNWTQVSDEPKPGGGRERVACACARCCCESLVCRPDLKLSLTLCSRGPPACDDPVTYANHINPVGCVFQAERMKEWGRGVCYWIPGQRSRTRTMRRREQGTTIRHSGVRLTRAAAAAASLKAEGRSRSHEGDGEPSVPSLPLPPEWAAQQGAGSRVAAAPIRHANDPHVKTQLGETHCYSYTSAMIFWTISGRIGEQLDLQEKVEIQSVYFLDCRGFATRLKPGKQLIERETDLSLNSRKIFPSPHPPVTMFISMARRRAKWTLITSCENWKQKKNKTLESICSNLQLS